MLDTARLRAASEPYRGSLYHRPPPEPVAAPVVGKPAGVQALPDAPTVGSVLRRWREARGLTTEGVELLSQDTGWPIGHTTVSRIERDEPRVRPGSYEAYLRVLLAWETRP